MKPHVCPKCNGNGVEGGVHPALSGGCPLLCPACGGAGVVWEPTRSGYSIRSPWDRHSMGDDIDQFTTYGVAQ